MLNNLTMVTVQVGIEKIQISSTMTQNELINDFGIKVDLNSQVVPHSGETGLPDRLS
jgi:sulfur carrier protein ThiS